MRQTTTPSIEPGQATYVITRLLNDRRLTPSDITRYLNDLQHEIASIEARLRTLRNDQPLATQRRTPPNEGTASNTAAAKPSKPIAPNTTSPNTAPRKRRTSPALRAQRQLQGRYLGYMRQLPAHDRPRFQAINARNGYPAAITALQRYRGK